MSIEKLFEGKDLDPTFVTEAKEIFEQAVAEKVEVQLAAKIVALEVSKQKALDAKLNELEELSEAYIEEEVMPEINKYLTAAVNEWQEENKEALESGAKVKVAESFLSGMTSLVAEHNLTVDAKDSTLVDELSEQVKDLQSKLDEQLDAKIELRNKMKGMKRQSVVEQKLENLTETQKEKVTPAIDKVEFKNDEQFGSAIDSLVEHYFPVETQEEVLDEQTQEEQLGESIEDPYLAALLD